MTMRRVLPALWMWTVLGGLLGFLPFARSSALPSIEQALPRGELRIGVDPSVAPFAGIIEDTLIGFDIDLGRALAERLNISVRFVPLGFDGLYDALYTDQVDLLIASLTVDPSRQDRVLYTPAYFDAGLALMMPLDSSILTINDIGGRRIAYALGSNAHSEANRWARRVLPFDSIRLDSETAALESVRTREADAALVDVIAARLFIRQHSEERYRYSTVTTQSHVIAVSADNAPLAVLVTNALTHLESIDDIEVLRARWL